MEPSKSIIWFQHMHKVAGGSIVDIAEQNRIELYKPNINGNPQYRPAEPGAKETLEEYQTTEIRYDRFPEKHLQSFVDVCINSKVQFIGCQWGFPKEPLMDPRIFYLTCFRNPWDRFLSNYSYDHFENPELYPNLRSWIQSLKPQYSFTRNNYYTLILAGLNYQHRGPITKEHYEIAKANLRKFDLVLILEDPYCFDILSLYLGWHYDSRKCVNVTTEKLSMNSYKKLFEIDNEYDLRLYEEACRIARSKSERFMNVLDIKWSKKLESAADCGIREFTFRIARKLDRAGNKKQAVELHLETLAKINSAKLRYISPRLLEIVSCHNQVEIVKVTEGVEHTLKIIHHLSYLCYHTPFKELGKVFCEILLETEVPHVYREHVSGTIKWY